MKKILFALMATLVSALVINLANAQNLHSNISRSQKNVVEINEGVTSAKNRTDDPEFISPKALKSFSKKFKNVTGEKWMKSKDGFSAIFISNQVRNIVSYSANGNWLSSVKGYSEDKLPYEIRDIVKRSYYDYSIVYVEELEDIDSQSTPTYIIHIEDKKNIKLVRVCDRQMDVMKQFHKG